MANTNFGPAGTAVAIWLAFCAAFALFDSTTTDRFWLGMALGGAGLFLVPILIAGTRRRPAIPTATLENAPGLYAFGVVGESHYQTQLEAVCGGRREHSAQLRVMATLVPEPTNPRDPDAVRVEINGKTVGYLPRTLGPEWGEVAAAAGVSEGARVEVPAEVRGGWDRGPNDRGLFGVWLDLPIAG